MLQRWYMHRINRSTCGQAMRVAWLFVVSAAGCAAELTFPMTVDATDGTTTFIKVAGTDPMTAAEWAKHCTRIPADARYIKMTMGTAVDYFKPVDDRTYCEMMQSNKYQLHSAYPAGPYDTAAGRQATILPTSTTAGMTHGYGGFIAHDRAEDVVVTKLPGDSRLMFSMWGHVTKSGGCCVSSHAATAVSWGHSFEIAFAPRGPPPAGAIGGPVVSVKGTDKADEDFWKEKCKAIPENTWCIAITIGAVVDFFKPTPGSSYCDMLASKHLHMYSTDGDTFHPVITDHDVDRSGFMGSAEGYPKTINKLDLRKSLHITGSSSTALTTVATTAAAAYVDGSGDEFEVGNIKGTVNSDWAKSVGEIGGKGSLRMDDIGESRWGTSFEVHLIAQKKDTDWAMIVGAIVGGVVALTLVVLGVLYAMKKGPFSSGSSMGTRMRF
jgi:hypothetical protein